MNRRPSALAAVAATGACMILAGTAGAHPMDAEHHRRQLDQLRRRCYWNSHGAAGSAPGRQSVLPREEGLELVGSFDLGGKLGGEGRVADVSAKGNYAYLTMFYEPTCGRGGVQIVDISEPAPDGRRLHPEPRRHLLG